MNVRERQSDRRERTRAALLESAARAISRVGYSNLVLEQVARDAGYTRGALYHLFRDKQDLVLAVSEWVIDTWEREVGSLVDQQADPLTALVTLARGHAVFCRRDIARVAIALEIEFSDKDDPIGQFIEQSYRELVAQCAGYVDAGRRDGTIPPGPPAETVALAFVGALEGAMIALADRAPFDEEFAVRITAGVLGLDPAAVARRQHTEKTE